MKARSIGPAVMSGRVTAVDAVVANPDIVYIGTASGGVWKSENGGSTFTPIFDEQPTLNIGSIAIQQSNPDVIWVGTGEGNPRNSVNIGAGMYKSIDGGKSWKMVGLEKTRNIHRICIDPQNPNVVYAGAIGNPYGEHPERGVFKTTDGGQTWEKILFTNDKSGVADMVMDPSNPQKLLVAMWEHRRTPWNFLSGGPGSGLYLTYDGGKTWKKLGKSEGLPDGDFGRLGLAISRSKPDRIYALVEATKNGLYRSDDGGTHWQKVTEEASIVTNRPFYFNEIYVDPQNENRIYMLYQPISMSEDGGKTFRVVAPMTTVHADHHALWINPNDPSLIYNGNDGGFYTSRDGGKKWVFADGLPLGQFYHVNVDNDLPYNIYGGLQDNGSWRGPSYTWTSGGIRNYVWQSLNGGDGFDVIPDPTDSRYGYAMSQGGNLNRYDALTGKSTFIKPTHPDPKVRLRFNWNAGLAQDPLDNATIYYGSQFLHKSTNKGMTWEIISPDLTLDNKETQKLSDETGGLSLDITSAENHNTILTIAPSAKEKGVIWVGTDDGNVHLTRDGGKNWINLSSRIGLPKESWIPQIRASEHNAAEALVVMNNYRMGDFGAYIYRTRDYGQTWERIVNDTQVRGYALCVQQDPVVPNLLFCGTEHGLWVSIDDAKTWTQWKAGVPSVSVMDLAIQKREADLVVATFGRALFVLDDLRPLRQIAQNSQLLNRPFGLFEMPEAYLAEYNEPIGYWSGGDALYEADNRPNGSVALGYFVAMPKPTPLAPAANSISSKNKKGKKGDTPSSASTENQSISITKEAPQKTDSLRVDIFDQNGKLVRQLRQKADSSVGYRRIAWSLDENPVRQPGSPRRPRSNESGEPIFPFYRGGGQSVLPGKYKLVMSYGSHKDSTYLTVKPDPRMPYDANAAIAKRQLSDRLHQSRQQLTQAIDRLDEAKETTDKILAQLKDTEDKTLKALEKQVKTMQDSLKAQRANILPAPMEKQGYGRPYRLTALTKLNEAAQFLRSKSEVTPSEIRLVEQTETLTKEAIEQINAFFKRTWADFRKTVEATTLPLFKD
ncbi:MAG: VPS10 domain-containing protein [Runella sp.]